MPFTEAASLTDTVLTGDVCIIGAGPAGITVASELAHAGVRVVVLESGGPFHDRHDRRGVIGSVRDHVSGSQGAAKGTNTGAPYFPLRLSRARGIGGSTAALKEHGLRSRPLDAIDFGTRNGRGWPIEHSEILEHIDEAVALCGIDDASRWWDQTDEDPLFEGTSVVPVAFRHGRRVAFAELASSLADGPDQLWITGATVTRLVTDSTGHVAAVEAATGDGSTLRVEAVHVVLATGGIDNARVLLNNTDVLESMGQAADNVGRHFMEHMHYVAGHIVPASERARSSIAERFCDIGEERWLTIDDPTVASESLARTAFLPVLAYQGSLSPGVNALGRLMRTVPYGPFNRSQFKADAAAAWRDVRKIPPSFAQRVSRSAERDCFAISAMSEQTPNPESRVTLSDRVDRYGLRYPILHWAVADGDWEAARTCASHLGQAVERRELGEFIPAWGAGDGAPPAFTGGWHHMGTTMMDPAATSGVVDTDLRVHGIRNLSIAGSSVFPTGGFANPTLSLVALSVRLGRHLRHQLGARP